MGKRRKARELALQFLFQLDMNPPGGAVNDVVVSDNSNEAVEISVGVIVNEKVNEEVNEEVNEGDTEIVTETVNELISKDVIKRVTKIVPKVVDTKAPEKVIEKVTEIAPERVAFENSTPNNIKTMIDAFWESFKTDSDLRPFFDELITGVTENREIIDKQINEVSENWKLNRMSVVDRNILRFSIFELMFMDDIPQNVTMNEAIEIAKRYGTSESPLFINGILDKVSNKLSKS